MLINGQELRLFEKQKEAALESCGSNFFLENLIIEAIFKSFQRSRILLNHTI
jgi:hypothetical protein